MTDRLVPGSAAATLFDLIASHRITAIIYVAVRLDIPDRIANGTKDAAALAVQTGADERSLRRLLRALVTIGICRQVGDGFELTEVGAPLAGDADRSIKAWALLEGEMLWGAWGKLLDSIRTGKTGSELAGAEDSFKLMARDPRMVKIFDEAMVSLTRVVNPQVLAAYDFSGITHLLDVGGGYGELLAAILKSYPSMRGSIFDRPHCGEGAKKQLREAGVADRAEFIAGDFFDSVPKVADAIIMKSIIHDWNDERSVTILRNCRNSLPAGGKLLLVERIMPETPGDNVEDRATALSDLNMLRGPGGAERTEAEYGRLLTNGGFTLRRIVPAGRFSVIEAVLQA
jgi:SAM-dependent methyltransferase